ncbi:MAG TPA: TonB-dependent receptor [Polyangiaceae bacterium]|nr:TonB-dependent receptor [Polyangiaceae bacterium]
MTTPLRKLLMVLAAVALLFAFCRTALADNVADEAEVEFEIGADRYKAGDFRGALEHFLASNRLVANKNVIFNIARTYEQLHQPTDAYRYYTQALEGEKDPAVQARIQEALGRLAPSVAVLSITSDPPGAAIYVDRRDLGARGSTPTKLGLSSGKYTVIVELPGYEPVEKSVSVQTGVDTPLAVPLRQIVGSVRVEGEPGGAVIRVDREDAPPAATLPATVSMPPGPHTLIVSSDGFVQSTLSVTVAADTTSVVHARLVPIAGNLVVSSDVRDALVEIDDRAMGFTPAVLNIPVGVHRVRVSLSGFRPVERTVLVTATGQAKLEVQLAQIEEVNAASRVTENLEDAPSSVSIITGAELRAMGYPTIAEALRGVRGVYVGNDTSYDNVGVRGFSRPGDYGTRVLVLLDGQPLNDDYVGQSYFGYDGRVDLADIERIEVIRGPGSVVYGTGAFFGVINLVTRSRNAPTHTEAGLSTSGNGIGTARAMQQVRFSPDSGVWTSVAAAYGAGRDYYFKEFASDAATGGNSRGSDGLEAGTVNGRLWWKSFTLQWFLTSRKKQLPAGEFGTLLGDPRTYFQDTRGVLEARFEPKVGKNFELLSRAHLNLYQFDDFLATPVDNGGNATESYRGQWFGVEQRVAYVIEKQLRLTLGGEYQDHFKAAQTGVAAGGVTAGIPIAPLSYLNRDDPFGVAAAYVSGDYYPLRIVKLTAGARFDYYTNSNYGSSLNPRAAVIVKPYADGNVKLMFGKAFRAPSVYEHFYTSPTQIPGGINLKPETVYSGELEYTHHFSPTVSVIGAGFYNYITDLINLAGDGTATSPNQYQNVTNPVESAGAEIELRREWRDGWMASAQYSYQRSRYLDNDGSLRDVPNSPQHLASVKAAAPLLGRVLMLMSRLSVEGGVYDRNDKATDPPQIQTNPFFVWDVVLSGEIEKYNVRYNLGVYNATNSQYSLPVSPEFTQDLILQSGRTLLAQGSVSF